MEVGGWRVEGFGRAPVATGDHDVIERSEALRARLLLHAREPHGNLRQKGSDDFISKHL